MKTTSFGKLKITLSIFIFLLFICLPNYSQSKNPVSSVHILVEPDKGKDTISKHIYGHFAEHLGNCIYGGFWVGENSDIPNTKGIRNDIVKAMKEINIPNLRWPGGCFADEYHWKDGIGDPAKRPPRVNTNWGRTEYNSFGTHGFMDWCEQLGAEPYFCGNLKW